MCFQKASSGFNRARSTYPDKQTRVIWLHSQ
jgi:hypothetical protein